MNDCIRRLMHGIDTSVKLAGGRCVRAVNLDNAATTPAFKVVVREACEQLKMYGSIGRGRGQKSEHSTEIYESGRDIIKRFVGAESNGYTVFYCNNTTDGINKLASALVESSDIVITTRMEHHANDLPFRMRCKVLHADVDEFGRLKIDDFERLLSKHGDKVKLVTVTAASNVTGYVNDVHAIAKLAHKYGARILVDGAQIVAHRKFSMMGSTSDENIDYFVFSAHKMYSPYGGGAVVGLESELNKFIPQFYGGGMVEAVCDESVNFADAPDSYEAGSPNYPGVVGMLKAIELLEKVGFDKIEQHEQVLMQMVIEGLRKIKGVRLYGDNDNIGDRVGILVFNIRRMNPDDVADALADNYGIATRHAAFCAHSYVRRLTGEAETLDCEAPPMGMVRASFGVYSNERDVEKFLCAVGEIASANGKTLKRRRRLAHLKKIPRDRG